jgi:RNA polymerase sigma-70 factor, ECF subfamily
MSLAKAGDQEAFAMLFERHRRLAFAIGSRIAGPAQADDVAQTAYLAAWQGCPNYQLGLGSPRAWLLAIVRFRAIDALRRDRGGQRAEDARWIALGDQRLQDAGDLHETRLIERESARRVRDALVNLPVSQRRAVELAYFTGLTHRQVAERLAIPLGTVKSRLRMALMKLEAHLSRTDLAHVHPVASGDTPGNKSNSPRPSNPL